MSKAFMKRMEDLLPLLFVTLGREQRKELDEEVERITGKECDEAARTLSNKEFESVARTAVENIRKRKKRTEEKDKQMVAAYA